MKQADRIREYVLTTIVEPARRSGALTVTFSAAEIHQCLGLQERFPAVCSAMDGDKWLEYAGLTLVERAGPEQSSTVWWTFRV